ncbi:MAG: YdcF family protein [Ferruginibacter sp.]
MNVFFVRLSIFFVLLTSTLLSSCSYSKKSARKLLEEAKTKSYDIIVVPGVPFNTPHWDKIMRGRVYWAKYLYDIGIAKNIMFSGSSVYTAYYEGEIMAMYAEAIGIPKEHIFTEINAEHSTENIYYSYKKAKKMGFKTIALASDQFQTRSLRRFAHKRLSPDIGMIPWVMPIIKKMDSTMEKQLVIDYSKAFNDSFVSIKKRQGLFKRLRGTWGKNLDTHLYD